VEPVYTKPVEPAYVKPDPYIIDNIYKDILDNKQAVVISTASKPVVLNLYCVV
jgi:hypothetical protein